MRLLPPLTGTPGPAAPAGTLPAAAGSAEGFLAALAGALTTPETATPLPDEPPTDAAPTPELPSQPTLTARATAFSTPALQSEAEPVTGAPNLEPAAPVVPVETLPAAAAAPTSTPSPSLPGNDAAAVPGVPVVPKTASVEPEESAQTSVKTSVPNAAPQSAPATVNARETPGSPAPQPAAPADRADVPAGPIGDPSAAVATETPAPATQTTPPAPAPPPVITPVLPPAAPVVRQHAPAAERGVNVSAEARTADPVVPENHEDTPAVVPTAQNQSPAATIPFAAAPAPRPSPVPAAAITAGFLPVTYPVIQRPEITAAEPATAAAETPIQQTPLLATPTLPAAAAPVQTSATAPVAPAPQPAALHAQLAKPLFTLATSATGEHVVTVRISPDELGPVTVRAHIGADGVRMELISATDAGRDAIRTILPELKRDLAGQGLDARLDLSSGTSSGNSSGSSADARQDRQDRPAARNPDVRDRPEPQSEQAPTENQRMYSQGPSLDVMA
ncbi:MAG TPA: flagellar hook-length control protein FliK [Arthrobacter sp.]